MVNGQYLTDTQLKKLLSDMVILVDTREQSNEHILNYLDKKKVKYKTMKLDVGDYSFMLPANEVFNQDMYFFDKYACERKASLEELSGNFTVDRNRLENEFIRSHNMNISLFVEDASMDDLILGKYKTEYKSKSFMASLLAFMNRYRFDTTFISKQNAGLFVYYKCYYWLRDILK